jgi:FkbM family methyltransferase
MFFWLAPRRMIVRKGTSDAAVFKQVFLQRQYDAEPETEPKIIIDAGANVGYASIFFARKFPLSRIIAIEPEENNFTVLQKNVKNFPNIEILRAALWDKEEEINVVDRGYGEWGFMAEKSEGMRGAVPGITVDELMKKFALEEIDILKMDIEGSEKEVFSGDCSWLSRTKMLIIELHERMRSGVNAAFFLAIAPYNFKITQEKDRENLVLRLKTDKID